MNKIDKKEMRAAIDEYLCTLDDGIKDEFYGTYQDMGDYVLEQFFDWLYKEEIERENRYKQYLELKAEFENESN